MVAEHVAPAPPGTSDGLVRAAEAAIRESGADPWRARRRARRVLEAALARGNAEAACVALRALALAARELGDLRLAESHLHRAIRAGAGVPRRLAQARMSLVGVRTELGDPAGALRVARQAERDLPPEDRAALAVQRAIALVRLGRHGEAARLCDRALAAPGADADPRLRCAALLHRGLARTYLGEHAAGAEDLAGCLRLATAAGLGHLAALAEAGLSFNAARRGDIPAAFAHHAAAERGLAGRPDRLAALRCDFAEALVAARLPGEARALLLAAVPELEAAGALVRLAEARLLLAQAELLTGDPHQASQTVRLARAELAGQGRHAWTPLADDVIVRARLALEPATPGLLADVLGCADALRAAGWATADAALRRTAAELAAELGDHRTAGRLLDEVIATRRPGLGRTHALAVHHAVALRRALAGDRAGALAAVAAGLREVDGRDVPAPIRAHAARPAEELAALGLELALHTGDAAAVLGCAERWRACVRGEPPGAFPADRLRRALGDAVLVELVRHGDALAAVVVTGDGCTMRGLGSYRDAVEATVRLRYCLRRRALRDDAGAPDGIARESAALAALLLDPLGLDLSGGPVVIVPTGALHTVPWPVLPPLRGRPVCVAPSAAAWLSAATAAYGPLGRIGNTVPCPARHAGDTPPDRVGRPDTTAPGPAAGRADSTVPGPPGHADGMVSGPAGRAGIAAPGLAGHAHGTVPGRTGCAAHGTSGAARSATVIAVAGPGLAHAEAEVAAVLGAHPGAARVPARTGAVLEALAAADVAHIAAHGMFCAHSPLLSSIALDDGPLLAYDLLRLDRVPALVVLSACDSGLAHAPADGAPLGLAGTFLDRGAACVVAGLVPVRDEDALALMTAFHRLLAAGTAPAAALAAAAGATGVAGFVCLGAGWPVTPEAEAGAG
ncbi:hypothetical protein GCM10010106_24620 [Thermopolyspora flexuosa]|uniref:CHAT domain-containing protein n=1 Tax=Thermopolyspora flexuosa TaxID=103836 RepID=A0A543IVG6_9ACTN|nr:CHAT domain-containing protein [Thermopolyspora flexuosa]TQM74574.1 CHAT domain-containing protein [Thermopolyspora flexuosa]GGM77279.1 hypothetical protein GCM10010106_24620 [Thermopolyspora flexuosa]